MRCMESHRLNMVSYASANVPAGRVDSPNWQLSGQPQGLLKLAWEEQAVDPGNAALLHTWLRQSC